MDKKLFFRAGFSALLSILFMHAYATIHVVSVSNFQFSPNALNVNVDDTVRFTWVSGTHTTTSVSIPNGAATWDSPMTSGTNQFDYKVTVAGNYGYKCTPHQGMGMVGGFVASTVTGVNENELNLTSLFPNPFVNELFIEQGNEQPEYSQVAISDILGKQLKSISIESLSVVSIGKRRIDVAELPKGIYFVTLKGNGAKSKTIRLVKEGV
jgi:plastocyanin